MIPAIEKELFGVEGLDDKETAARSGRSKGVSYCWKNALGESRAENSRATSISRAWKRSDNWVRDVSRTRNMKVANVEV